MSIGQVWLTFDWEKCSELISEHTVNLTRFTCLQVLKLVYVEQSFHQHFDSLSYVISNISSTHLDKLHVHSYNSAAASIDVALSELAHLKAIDDVLALARFASLNHVALEYEPLNIYIQAIPTTSLSPSGVNTVPTLDSCAQSDPPSDKLISTQPSPREPSLRNPHHPFKLYSEFLVRRRIWEELKQLGARSLLETKLGVRLVEREIDVDTGSDENKRSNTNAASALDGHKQMKETNSDTIATLPGTVQAVNG